MRWYELIRPIPSLPSPRLRFSLVSSNIDRKSWYIYRFVLVLVSNKRLHWIKTLQFSPSLNYQKNNSHAICHFNNEGKMSSWNTTPDINILDRYQDSQITIIATIEGHQYIDSGHCLHGICVLSYYVKSPRPTQEWEISRMLSLPRA
jgi:hypothetical protein